MKRHRWWHIPLGAPALLLLWYVLTRDGLVSPFVLAKPESVVSALLTQGRSSSLWVDIGMTTYRALSGLILSAICGIPLGLFLGYVGKAYRHVALPLDIIRSIPSATLFPIFILAFGIGNASKVAVVFYGCFFLVVMAAVYGGRGTSDRPKRILMIHSLRATPFQVFRYVVLPDALPNILSGLRIAASIAFVLVVVTEMFLGANSGLGKRSTTCICLIVYLTCTLHCYSLGYLVT
ncbi:MAG: ABC transporter permease subunit [Flavobacteriales bacterium]